MKYIGRTVAVTASAALAAMAFVGQASADADKTDNHVALHVTGKKLHVDDVTIYGGSPSNNYCLNARVTFDNSRGNQTYYLWHPRGQRCGNGDYYTGIAKDTRWPNGTKICAAFYRTNGDRWGGKPCATIHN
ncbi:hypothetical protein ACGFWD_26190 [Streptomyces sp. NPDC048448]|uniref:hypothetical protein n=1 Tax=unclassified Streptomyces TaxID=2593676 RepID=UPI00372439A4